MNSTTLRLLVLAFCFAALSRQTSAQTYFDFGADAFTPRADCPVVVFARTQTSGDYTVAAAVKNMVFDDALQYSKQLMLQSFTPKTVNQPTGFFHIRRQGYNLNMPYGDVTGKFDSLLGCGVYHFTLTMQTESFGFDLDLTDANWGLGTDSSFRNVLIAPEKDSSQAWGVRIWISTETRLSTQLINCGWYGDSSSIRYWELVRHHGGPWSTYERVRDGFIIDPNYTGPDPNGIPNTDEIPFKPTLPQKLEVHVHVEGDVVVPNGSTFRVGTEPNPQLYESQETHVRFASGKGITVESGGELISENSGPSGIVIWDCYSQDQQGAWTGIRALPASKASFTDAFIRNAVKGLSLDSADATLTGTIIERSSHIGLEVIRCSPTATLCEFSQTGRGNGAARTANVFITGTGAAPVFTYCYIASALKNTPGNGTYYGGNGVEITGTDAGALFDGCVIEENDSCGFNIHDAYGPRIYECWIDNNGKNIASGHGGQVGAGIYINRGVFWTTLQRSKVSENMGSGIYLDGISTEPARLRGWWHSDDQVDPNTPTGADAIESMGEYNGENCIVSNGFNIYSRADGRYDFAAPYLNSQSDTVLFGGLNSICRPTMGNQVRVNSYSDAQLLLNWWENDYSIYADGTSIADYSREIGADTVYCVSDHKIIARGVRSFARNMMEMKRASWRSPVAAPTDQPGGASAPLTATITSAYPNPFNPTVRLNLTVSAPQSIRLLITDVFGREIAVLTDAVHAPGNYTHTFDASNLPSGRYFAILRTADGSMARPLHLVK